MPHYFDTPAKISKSIQERQSTMTENINIEHAELQKGGQADVHQEETSYHAVEKDGKITAIWEMRGRKHIRTIDPRSAEGRHLLGHPDNPETAHSAQA
jgi:hypothetical protein